MEVINRHKKVEGPSKIHYYVPQCIFDI